MPASHEWIYTLKTILICSFNDVNGTNGTEIINSTTTVTTTIATTTKRVAVDLPKKGAAEEEHHSSFTIFFILLVVGIHVFVNKKNLILYRPYKTFFVLNIAFFLHFEFSLYAFSSQFIGLVLLITLTVFLMFFFLNFSTGNIDYTYAYSNQISLFTWKHCRHLIR